MSEEQVNKLQAIIKKQSSELTGYKEQLEYLNDIISYLPGHVYWLDKNNVYLGCNDLHAHDVNLKSRFDIVNKTNFDMPWKDQAEKINSFNNNVMSTGKIATTEESEYFNNVYKTFLSQKVPLKNKKGEVIGILGISIDITEQKRLEAIKDDFISNMQHDIRTPFAGISAVADLFRSVYSSKYPEIKSISEIQDESCMQWEKVQNNLLGVIDTKQPINIERFYLQDKIDEVKKLLHATAEVRHLDLILEYPCREETGEISSDKLKTSLILSSLVSNALNFTENGSVTIKLRKKKAFFVIDIIDTGIGIPADKLEYIFEKFSKLNRSNKYGTNFKGVGLGLYRARRDARKIGGKISVKSIEGVGSTFTLILPLLFNVSI